MMVIFTNHEWVCSSGHVSDYDKIPVLRRPDLDNVEWMKKNYERVAREIPVKTCADHSPGAKLTNWGWDGHLWRDNLITLSLCLPRLSPRPAGTAGAPYYG